MLEQKVKIISESLARSMGRRTFLKRTGNTVFMGLAAVAAGHILGGSAAANKMPPGYEPPNCAPPGPYCNTGGGDLSGCGPNGYSSQCYQHLVSGQVMQCKVYYEYYTTGCWTASGSGGYWTCCDCACYNTSGQRVAACGCAGFSGGPIPRPDSPDARGDDV